MKPRCVHRLSEILEEEKEKTEKETKANDNKESWKLEQ